MYNHLLCKHAGEMDDIITILIRLLDCTPRLYCLTCLSPDHNLQFLVIHRSSAGVDILKYQRLQDASLHLLEVLDPNIFAESVAVLLNEAYRVSLLPLHMSTAPSAMTSTDVDAIAMYLCESP